MSNVMVQEYDEKVTLKCPELFKYIQNSYLKNKILYFIDSKVKIATDLKVWTEKIMNEPISEIERTALSKINVEMYSFDYDSIVEECLQFVTKNIKYTPDILQFNQIEKWQTPTQTLQYCKGDCEDGAILLYRLCRLKGVPANRLFLFCGDVEAGGHCWLGYKSNCFPLNFVFLDWCYDVNFSCVYKRPKYYISNTNRIFEFRKFDNYSKFLSSSNYSNVWFAWNEETNIKKFVRR